MTVLFFPAATAEVVVVVSTTGGATIGVEDGAFSHPVALAAASVSWREGASPHPPDAVNSSAFELTTGGWMISLSSSAAALGAEPQGSPVALSFVLTADDAAGTALGAVPQAPVEVVGAASLTTAD